MPIQFLVCRWTVKAAALQAILDNYSHLLSLWDQCNDIKDTELIARIAGVQVKMETFSFYYGKLPMDYICIDTNIFYCVTLVELMKIN